MKKEITFLAGLLIFNISSIFAQAGTLDKTFSGDGKAITLIGNVESYGNSVAIQSNGKIVVAGSFRNSANEEDFAVVRYNSNGSLDNSFSRDGRAVVDFGAEDYAYAVAIQADGKIVAAGLSFFAGQTKIAVARLNSNGNLDRSFSGDGRLTTQIDGNTYSNGYSVAIQPDGKIVVAGNSGENLGTTHFAIVRYNSNGSLDKSFSGDGKASVNFGSGDGGQSVAIQANGKIVVAGYSDNLIAVARLNSNGSLDNSFSGDGKVTTLEGSNASAAYSVVIQADGKIVVAGYYVDNTARSQNFAVVRYNNNGILDNSFSGDGKAGIDFGGIENANSAAIQGDGKIVMAGYSQDNEGTYKFAVGRLNSNGTVDNSFSGDGRVITDFVGSDDEASSIAIQPDGKIVVVGYTDNNFTPEFAVARYLGSSSSLTVTDESSINANAGKLPYIRLFPNPVKNTLSIGGMDATSTKTISIVDMSGRIIRTTTAANSIHTWNIASVPAGTYYLLIDDKKNKTSLKFVKE